MSTSQSKQILEERQYLEGVYGLVEGSHFFVCLFAFFFFFCHFTLRAWAVPLEVQEKFPPLSGQVNQGRDSGQSELSESGEGIPERSG